MLIEENISLKPYNTLAVDASAAYFAVLKSPKQLIELLHDKRWRDTPKYFLGGGSNVLFTRDYPGLILKNETTGLEILQENNEQIQLKMASGENWHDLVMYCVNRNYGGIENLSLIPGTVGAAPMQNIGAYGVEFRSVFNALEAINLSTGKIETFSNSDCDFGYRSSIFKTSEKGKYFITQVIITLTKQPTLNTQYGAIKETMEALALPHTIKGVSDAVIQIRQSKLPDPKKIPNAGSFFKNPMVTKNELETLQCNFPEIPHYEAGTDKIKIPAAWLIEKAGWKGKTIGKAGVHKNQALVLVNQQQASGDELKTLSEKIQKSVNEQFHILLEAEVNII